MSMRFHRLFLILAALNIPLATANADTGGIKLPWSVDQIAKLENLHCSSTSAPTNDELRAEVLKTEEPRLLEILKILLKDRNGALSTSIPEMNVIEAAQTIFGERQGLQLLYLFTHYRVNASHLQAPETAAWKAAELDDVILGLSDLPEHLVPFPLNRYIKRKGYLSLFRHKRGDQRFDDDGIVVFANATITLFDAWSEQPAKISRRYTVFHEVSHNLQNLIPDGKSWTILHHGSRADAFVTGYSKTNAYEDFAESVTAYRYTPHWLMKRNPQKYAYLREVIFNGLEYLSEESCRNAGPTLLEEHARALGKAFSEYTPALTDAVMKKEKLRCDAEYLKNLSAKTHDKCLSALYAKGFAQEYRSEFIRYMDDTKNVRSADGTGGIGDPKMNASLEVKIGKAARSEIRKMFIEDFNSFKSVNGADAKSCDQLATQFAQWTTGSGEKTSTLFRAGLTDSSYASFSITGALRRACEKGVALRPNYVALLEKFKGQGPLTAAEFRYGIQEVIR